MSSVCKIFLSLKIYYSILQVRELGVTQLFILCERHKCLTPKWFIIKTNSIIRSISFFFTEAATRVVLQKKAFLEIPQACNFIKKETLAQVFSCEFCEISKNTFSAEHLRTTASIFNIKPDKFSLL